MTDQEINIAVAQVLGVKCGRCAGTGKYLRYGPHEWARVSGYAKNSEQPWTACDCLTEDHAMPYARLLPRYTEDLNACNEMENTMDEETYRMFIGHLVSLLKPGEFSVRAKARPRSIAFLKVHGKYTGEDKG